MNQTIARTLLVLSSFAGILTNASASPTDTPYLFEVKFDGLFIHDFDPEHPARALIVQGDDAMPHVPLLITDTDIDEAALAAATGNPVFCGRATNDTNETCRVLIEGLDIQIVGNDGSAAGPPLAGHRLGEGTFYTFVPHLSRVTKGTIKDTAAGGMPQAPLAGFFELTGGTLSACVADSPGFFVPDFDNEKNHYFADIVTLNGLVDARAKAVLQIRSAATHWQWMTISRDSNTPLKITIDNHAPRKKGKLIASTHHFGLVQQMLSVSASGFPIVCKAPPDSGDSLCKSNEPSEFLSQGTIPYCPPRSAAPAMSVGALKSPTVQRRKQKTSGPSFEILPGCANSTWP